MTLHVDRIYLIAEAGVNHNGSLARALAMVETAARAGADAVKFQSFRAKLLAAADAPKAAYQQKGPGAAESQYEMLRRLELDPTAHRELRERCRECGIDFLSTPFDSESLEMLSGSLDLPLLKLGSGEITNGPLLLQAARTGKPVILSTGMSTLQEVAEALGVLAFGYRSTEEAPSLAAFRAAFASLDGQQALREHVCLLHCTTEYPAPYAEVNLRAMDTLRESFALPVGLSDHTQGIAVAIAAAARGARVIEKHFTMERTLPGPDHQASLEPGELATLVASVRQVELALGSPDKVPAPCETANRAVARKSLVASTRIVCGELFTPDNVTVKRPGDGIAPMHYWERLGTAASRDYREDERIS